MKTNWKCGFEKISFSIEILGSSIEILDFSKIYDKWLPYS